MSLAIENTKPGVTVLVNQSQVGSVVKRQPTSTAFVVGYVPWGPVDKPTTITSWADFVRQLGGFNSNSYLAAFLYIFFNLFKGATAVVCRVAGASAAVATKTLMDRASTPVATLRVDAKYPSSTVDVRVKVEAGTATNTVKLTFRSVKLGYTPEVYDNFDLSAAAISEINQKSKLVKLTNLASATASPNNLPALLAETILTGGSDDFAGINAARYIGTDDGTTRTGLQAFNSELLGTGQVAIPGITSSTVHAALVAHAEAYHRLALLDPPLGSDKDEVAAIRALYGTWYGALAWPWFEARDFSGATDLKMFYPPSAVLAGACAQADRTVGIHKAPANFVVPEALDVERAAGDQTQADEPTLQFLNGKDVNVILRIPEGGIRVYGARVMTADRRVQMMHEIRVLNLCYYSLKTAYMYAVFSVVGAPLFRELASVARAFLRNLWRAGALYGRKDTDAFAVKCDEFNNPEDELAAGRVHVDIGVKISSTAESIIVNIDNVPLGQDLGVLAQQ